MIQFIILAHPLLLYFFSSLQTTILKKLMAEKGKAMETVINNENRNILVERVVSGEVPVEKAIIGLARVEVKIFYRKLDRASQTMNAQQSQLLSDVPVFDRRVKPVNSYTFPKESSGPFTIYTKFQALVA